jgi:hypothetical protein
MLAQACYSLSELGTQLLDVRARVVRFCACLLSCFSCRRSLFACRCCLFASSVSSKSGIFCSLGGGFGCHRRVDSGVLHRGCAFTFRLIVLDGSDGGGGSGGGGGYFLVLLRHGSCLRCL